MSKISVAPPSGFRDFTPEETAVRQHLMQTIAEVYQNYAFQQISLSALENLATLQGKGGGSDNEKLIFKVLKRGEELERAIEGKLELADLGLRFELTLSLARYYSRFQAQLPKPFKVFQMGPVWRADRPQKGRFREFVQCDVDVLGSKEIGAEIEVLNAILAVFERLGLSGLELHLNDRRLLMAFGKNIGMDEAKWKDVLITLDKLDKIGPEKVRAELEAKGVTKDQLESIKTLLKTELSTVTLSEWSKYDQESTSSLQGIIDALASTKGTTIRFNPLLVRGQEYYTGTIFEVQHPTLSGSLAGGGRYNRLLEIFGGQETPAFGGSIGFERLAMILAEQKKETNANTTPHVFLPLFSEKLRPNVVAIARRLRALGARVDVYPDAAKMKNQFKYADDRKISFTAVLGESELEAYELKWKNMATREEISLSLDEKIFEQHVKKALNL